MNDWFTTLDGLLSAAWSELAKGVAAAEHPARLTSFSTISANSEPEARFVVLRHADQSTHRLEVQSDLRSAKFESLQKAPKAALLWWIPAVNLQIRAQASVEIVTGPILDDAWSKVPAASRVSYGTNPAPGTPIATALSYSKEPDRASFAVLRCHLDCIDLVHLGHDHRRAIYTRDRDWQGQWLSP